MHPVTSVRRFAAHQRGRTARGAHRILQTLRLFWSRRTLWSQPPVAWTRRAASATYDLTRRAAVSAWRHRVLGLAAETGFWTLLSMPPLLLCLLGLVGYLATPFSPALVPAVEQQLLDVADRIVTRDAVTTLIQPVVHNVLTIGRADVASLGFVIALFSGSTAMSSYVNALALAYGQRSHRGAVHSRLLAIGLYLAALIVGALLLPLLVAGPQLLLKITPTGTHDLMQAALTVAYWPVIAALSVLLLTTMYHLAIPTRTRWRAHLPGAMVAMSLWLIGSIALRAYVTFAFRTVSVYGPVATPIAALLFFYLSALAVLVGAEINAQRRPPAAPTTATQPQSGTSPRPPGPSIRRRSSRSPNERPSEGRPSPRGHTTYDNQPVVRRSEAGPPAASEGDER
ncbi:membrane protein [Kribbella pratensis]|uniref:Membrane protein n=1 Tax=Kribbella pratensis TaxID=2512112 RepID=A0ABY2FQH9_9ACTN|nr:YihY/virulence factor BrkB family protein [Kribbella pratensis]TDW95405.1 membrane protein [Kribbella pratensis]